ncbi:MAG: CDP-alcohol phosphatidyltransferase family protein [Pseudomonadales bacterium]
MRHFAHVVGRSDVRLWSLSANERIRRQLTQTGDVTLVDTLDAVPANASVLLLRADFLYEVRTLKALLERTDTVLRHGPSGVCAGAITDAATAPRLRDVLLGETELPAQASTVVPDELGAFDHQLRKAKAPLLEPVSAERQRALEALLYGTSYKGITDLVTKFVWPRPARHVVRFCATLGITPNMVTALSLALMLWTCYLFANGQFALGLASGWVMTFLDTVDGKLARVTIRSSRFGHVLDHGMDLIHPPFWYYLWGTALIGYQPLMGLGLADLNVLIIGGYLVGRAVEGLFHLLGDASIFSWRPFDAYFRLITARRNPCIILLSASLVVARPDWGLVAVALWTAGTSALLIVRLLQGMAARVRSGPLQSWLADPETAAARHPRAYRLFSGTQSAYASA